MALTKPTFYLVIISIVIIIFGGLAFVGTSLVNKDRINLNDDSLDYILELKGINDDSGYTNISNKTSASSQTTNILGSDNDLEVSDTNDFLSAFYIKKERASQPVNYFKLIYHLPKSIIKGIDWDLSDWSHYINVLSYMFLLALLIMIWTKFINT